MSWIAGIAFTVAVVAAGSTGMLFPPGEYYKRLRKPGWTPPNWAFPVGWTTLYILMVVGGLRLSSHAESSPWAADGLALWCAQISLNTLWTPVFFGLHKPGSALVVMGALIATVSSLVWVSSSVDTLAVACFVPYLCWILYAGSLNLFIFLNN